MTAEVNYEALILFGRFGGAMLGLLLLVWLTAVLTPKAARLIDRIMGKPRPERVQDNIKPEEQAEPAPLSPPTSDKGSPEHTKPPQGESEKTIDSGNYKVYSIFEDRPQNDEK